jgi:DNA-binding transcriptional LysR family regulator
MTRKSPARISATRLFKPAEIRPPASGLTPALLLALQAFDAAYRLASFRAAADALHLTPSAVSHRIRHLEQLIGDSLFTRAHRAVQPTSAGRTLAAATGRAFAELARAVSSKDAPGPNTRLRLAVVPTFETAWLIPRVARFLEAHPAVELVIERVSRGIDFDNEPYDAAICGGAGDWPGLRAVPLMRIFTTPICMPEMAQRLVLRDAADLCRATLIHVTSYPLAWRSWFEFAGCAETVPRQTIWVDSFGSAQQAAERGIGVALGLAPLIEESVAGGRLACPLAPRNPTGDYWFVHRPLDERNPALRAFKQWLLASIADEQAATPR